MLVLFLVLLVAVTRNTGTEIVTATSSTRKSTSIRRAMPQSICRLPPSRTYVRRQRRQAMFQTNTSAARYPKSNAPMSIPSPLTKSRLPIISVASARAIARRFMKTDKICFIFLL